MMMFFFLLFTVILNDVQMALGCSLLAFLVSDSEVQVVLSQWGIGRNIDMLMEFDVSHTDILNVSE